MVGVLPYSVGGGVLPGLVIRQGLLPRFVVGHQCLLVAVNLALLFLQEGRGGGAAAAPSVISPTVGPSPQQIHPPPFHQDLDLGATLVIHGTLAHEAGIFGSMGMLRRAVGG